MECNNPETVKGRYGVVHLALSPHADTVTRVKLMNTELVQRASSFLILSKRIQ